MFKVFWHRAAVEPKTVTGGHAGGGRKTCSDTRGLGNGVRKLLRGKGKRPDAGIQE